MSSSEFLPGIYERVQSGLLEKYLLENPELRAVFEKIDREEEPAKYSAFVARFVEAALRQKTTTEERLAFCNDILEKIFSVSEMQHSRGDLLPASGPQLLTEITPTYLAQSGLPRPFTPLAESSLFTGAQTDPPLANELALEMASADGVDILVSFIKWSGLRLLADGLRELSDRGVPIRLITTSYMGASDARAVEWIASLASAQVRVSYDTKRTRLHAKAYHFHRESGFSTAYIGSSNMSDAAMTNGLEWNLKVTAQDQPHIIEKFRVEFETYWNSREFVPFDPERPEVLREAITFAKQKSDSGLPMVFFEIKPHAFQERILEALEAERAAGYRRNLVVAATGTGKTVVAAFDYKRQCDRLGQRPRLLFAAHREEILKQSLQTYRAVLRDPNFGQLLVGNFEPDRFDHLFCSIGMLENRDLLKRLGKEFYKIIVIDEAHHSTAPSYRVLTQEFQPEILLALTATPERMDGSSVVAEFHHRFAAEIRLPEALDEKLLAPFHYFVVEDPVSLDADKYWTKGRFNQTELTNVYTGAHALAQQRLRAIVEALQRYQEDIHSVRCIGFCASVNHAEFMAEQFNAQGLPAACFVGDTIDHERAEILRKFRAGELNFLFTVDVLSEGADIPEVDTVLFLRPTDSMTVFLQQLGRGLRLHPGKECLTVLDFVGHLHKRYRIDRKFKALLRKDRFNIERELESGFPHLPAGCSIRFERVAREHVLRNIKSNLANLRAQIIEHLETFRAETNNDPTFKNFSNHHGYEPLEILGQKRTWSEFKAAARLQETPTDPDLEKLRAALAKVAAMSGRAGIARLQRVLGLLQSGDIPGAITAADPAAMAIHYQLWGKKGSEIGVGTIEESFQKLADNPASISDCREILELVEDRNRILSLTDNTPFEIHANYTNSDIQSFMGATSMSSPGQQGVGVVHFKEHKAYALLVTFQKSENEFSPSTMYADYPISPDRIHWESQSNTTQSSNTGQNLIHHAHHGYRILIFAREKKKQDGFTLPFTYLGQAIHVSHESERPIKMVWQLDHPMPAEMFENCRKGG
jgi:superfamily II DNA or RNA helicase/HKD family nuclease